MPMHYVLVADASRARLLTADDTFDTIEEVADFTHPGSRLHTRELVTDGKTSSWSGPGGAHSATGSADAHHEEAKKFSHDLGRKLHDARVKHAFERLVLVAPPKFLGLLRDQLDAVTARTVVASVAHDYTHLPLHELGPAIKRQLPEDAGL